MLGNGFPGGDAMTGLSWEKNDEEEACREY